MDTAPDSCCVWAYMRYFGIVRRILVVAVAVCSLMWAVAGVSVLVIAFHEHHHHHHQHHAETHSHDAVFELVLHCHDNEGLPHHDHELTAQLSGSRASWSGHLHSAVSQASDFVDVDTTTVGALAGDYSESRDLGPPAYLMHCVLLT